VVVAPLVDEVSDLTPDDGGGLDVAETLISREFDLLADPQRLGIIPLPVGDVRDLAPDDGGLPGLAETLIDRELAFPADPQRLS
jgi:hypothetical protein